MLIKKIEFENIRNLSKVSLDLKPKTVIIFGKNAQGKTNFLEAVYCLALTKSPRKGKEKDIINANKKRARIKGFFENKEGILTVEYLLGNKKTIKFNNKKTKARNVVGNILISYFSVDDLQMIENPQKRRRFADILLSFLDKLYFIDLVEYQAAVKRRNKLLSIINKEKRGLPELDIWDNKISELGISIIKKREILFKKINKIIERSPFFKGKTLKIKYKPQTNDIKIFKEKLRKSRNKDIILEQTTTGPHRDDIIFFIGELPLDTHGSRGEKRGAVVELKKAEIELMFLLKKEKPILLLDDVFSELDEENKKHVLAMVSEQQTIITTTNPKDAEIIKKYSQVIELSEGNFIK